MESEAMLSSNKEHQSSRFSEATDQWEIVTSAHDEVPQHIPATDPSGVALLWSSVFEEKGDPEFFVASATQSSTLDGKSGVWISASARMKALRGGLLSEPTRRPKLNSEVPSMVHVQEKNPVIGSGNTSSTEMPCNMGDDKFFTKPAHYYFCLKHEKDNAAAAEIAQCSSGRDNDNVVCKDVLAEYNLLSCCHSSGNAFSQLTQDRFFNLDSLRFAVPSQEQHRALKVNTSATTIEHSEWLSIPGPESQYMGDLHPFACTFWLPAGAYGPGLEEYLSYFTCCLGDTMIFPYLTVDFRGEEEQIGETRLRAAYSGTQALFNRFRLHKKAWGKAQPDTEAGDSMVLCHFIILFDKKNCEGWQITVDKHDEWTGKGCTMRRIFYSSLRSAKSIQILDEWIHEIHHWAATRYGPAGIEEIRTCLDA